MFVQWSSTELLASTRGLVFIAHGQVIWLLWQLQFFHWLIMGKLKIGIDCYLIADRPAPITQLVECPHRGTGGHGFDPGPRRTKVVKNGTSCSSLGTQIYRVELGLVDPVSG